MRGLKVIVCDVEETLLDDGAPTVGLGALGFLLHSRRDWIRLVYVTGMPYPSAAQLVDEGILPAPDAVCASGGTAVWFPPWRFPDMGYLCRIDRNWDHSTVLRVVRRHLPAAGLPGRFQNAWRVRCLVTRADVLAMARIRRELEARGVEARVVGVEGGYMDVVPAAAGKRSGVQYVLERWKCDPADVLVCGGPADLDDLLDDSPFLKVMVGGSCTADSDLDPIGSTSDGPHERTGMHRSFLPFAAGVLEGARVHRFWVN